MTRYAIHRTFCLLLLVSCVCLLGGCGDAGSMLQGTLGNLGAKVIDSSSDEAIRAMFEQANDACPIRMDAYTTLESVKAIDNQRFEFHYKVNSKGKDLARRFDKQALKKAAVEHMKGKAMAVAIAERDLSVEHIYEDAFGGHILSYTINKQVLAGNLHPVGGERENPFDVQTVSATAEQDLDVTSAVAPAEIEKPVAVEKPAVVEKPVAVVKPVETEKPPLPQAVKQKRSKDNPAGVRSNPFFDA